MTEFAGCRADLLVENEKFIIRMRSFWMTILVCGIVCHSQPAIAQVDQQLAQEYPVRRDDGGLSGDGWIFTAASGWTVREGGRRGDFEVVKE